MLLQVIVYVVQEANDFYTAQFLQEDSQSRPILPINTLRNLAVDHASTNYIFTV